VESKEAASTSDDTVEVVGVELAPELAAVGYVDVSPAKDRGVLKLVKQAGYDSDCPLVDDNITVHYVATLADDGVQYDSSWKRGKPFTFRLGKGQCRPVTVDG